MKKCIKKKERKDCIRDVENTLELPAPSSQQQRKERGAGLPLDNGPTHTTLAAN